MKITAIVEKGRDGLYSIYSDALIGRDYLGGFGDSVDVAKGDFMESIKEAVESAKSDGFDNVPTMEEISVEFKFDKKETECGKF